MSDIKAISDEEEHIFDAPNSSGSSNLRQSPANPRLNGISKKQGNANYPSKRLSKMLVTPKCRMEVVRLGLPSKQQICQILCISNISQVPPSSASLSTRLTNINISLSRSRYFHGDDVRVDFVIEVQLQRATQVKIAGIGGE